MLRGSDYDLEPVYYCEDCLSLRICSAGDIDYCDDCGSTSIGRCLIEEWERLHSDRYNIGKDK